ncbi:MAG TPA: hypothetical protein VIE65_12395 [Methylobacter sp.]|jgi:hypothetical protein
MNKNTASIRELKEGEVTFFLTIESEEVPVDGHFDSDEPEKDRKFEREIKQRLARHDYWAWCTVKITACWEDISESDCLGCCSYESEDDFKKDNYYEDMKATALSGLNKKIQERFHQIRELVEVE